MKNGVDTLVGPLPKILKFKQTPYHVIADIEVPSNKIVTIEPGVVILFKNFTGLHITGKLIAEGTKNRPIVFTSINDNKYNPEAGLLPNPYDWNGIYIHDDAFSTIITNSIVAYSVYGIIADTKFFKLDQITFLENGKYNLMIEGKEHTVTSAPYSYILSTKDATKDGIPIKLFSNAHSRKRNILRYTGLAAAVGGLGLGIYYATEFSDASRDWDRINGPNADPAFQQDPDYRRKTEDRKNKNLALLCTFLGIGTLGTVTFIWSFAF